MIVLIFTIDIDIIVRLSARYGYHWNSGFDNHVKIFKGYTKNPKFKLYF
jgi:hypothetical protein